MSSTGKNAVKMSFMAKLGEMISGALHNAGKTMNTYAQTMNYGVIYGPNTMSDNADMLTIWTLQAYKNELSQDHGSNAEKAWDELEKSIMARLADDIVVGVKGDRVDLVIKKNF